MTDELHLDWASAEVNDGELTVPLSAEAPKGFKPAFRHTARLLGDRSAWGEVELHKGVVHVHEVQEGSEANLRHHLEGIVTQANAALARDAADEHRGDGEEPTGPDAEMTDRFRAFAAPDDAQAD